MSKDQIVINDDELLTNQETYDVVRGYVVAAQKQVNAAVLQQHIHAQHHMFLDL